MARSDGHVGMCPATLPIDPIHSDATDVTRTAVATAAAGFPTLSFWASSRDCRDDCYRKALERTRLDARVIEAFCRWVEGPEAAESQDVAALDLAVDLRADMLLGATIEPAVDRARAVGGLAAVCRQVKELQMEKKILRNAA
jgi:hypothetical protein